MYIYFKLSHILYVLVVFMIWIKCNFHEIKFFLIVIIIAQSFIVYVRICVWKEPHSFN